MKPQSRHAKAKFKMYIAEFQIVAQNAAYCTNT